MTIHLGSFALPQPGFTPELRTTHVHSRGSWHKLNLKLFPVVPGEVYAVCEEARDHLIRLEAGEFLAVTLDDDKGFDYPSRYQEGSFAALRGAYEIEFNMLKYGQRNYSGLAEGSGLQQDLERGEKVRHWQRTLVALNQAVWDYIGEVRTWALNAERTGNHTGLKAHADQLSVLTFRPVIDWNRRVERCLRDGRLDVAVAHCDMYLLRRQLEPVLSMLSHNLHFAERHRRLEIRHTLLVEQGALDECAEEILEPMRHRIERVAKVIGTEHKRTLTELAATAQAMKSGQLQIAKEQLEQVTLSFALMM